MKLDGKFFREFRPEESLNDNTKNKKLITLISITYSILFLIFIIEYIL
jgi:hypothetical protein